MWLAVIVLACAPLAERIPMPVIGGLILVVGGELIWGRRHDVALVWRTSKLSAAAMVVTFLGTTQLPLQQAVILSAVLSLLLYCAQAARQARLVALVRDEERQWTPAPVPERLASGTVTVLRYEGVSLFAELPRIDEHWPAVGDAHRPVLVLSLRGLPDVPSSGMIKLLRRRAAELGDAGGRLMLAGVDPHLLRILRDTGLADTLGDDGIVAADGPIMAPLERAVARAGRWLADRDDRG
nr:hypothetical protein GCM10020092_056510 [Actinoplanes digitatis]